MKEQKRIDKIVQELKDSELLTVSLASLEVAYSNFISKKLRQYPELALDLFKQYLPKDKDWTLVSVVTEKKFVDITLDFKSDNDKHTVKIENKFKRLATKEQLVRYTEKDSSKFSYVLLTFLDFNDLPPLWEKMRYSELIKKMEKHSLTIPDGLPKLLIENFVNDIKLLTELLVDRYKMETLVDYDFYEKSKLAILRELEVADLYLKNKHSMLSERLRTEVGSNYYVYDDFSRGTGISGIDLAIHKGIRLGIQIQENIFKIYMIDEDNSGLDRDKMEVLANKLADSKLWFDFIDDTVLEYKDHKKWLRYNDSKNLTLYRYHSIRKCTSINELIQAIKDTLSKLEDNDLIKIIVEINEHLT